MELDRSILIVDDESDQARLYAGHFARMDWRAKAVFSGQDAIDTLKDGDYGVVLLDMKMPDMDGFQTLAAILKLRPDQCVVFFTGFGDFNAAVRALHHGACSMVLKDGIDFDTLHGVVELELKRKTEEVNVRAERDAAIVQQTKAKADVAKMESMSTLANGCAHSIKNRLVAITTRLDLIESAVAIEDARNKALEARTQLGNAFLAIKRLERICKIQGLELSSVNLTAAVDEAVELTKQAHSHHVNRRIRLSKNVQNKTLVKADREFIVEAIENILSNSVEAMFDAGGTIELTCVAIDGHADITVFDAGPGFPDDMLGGAALEPFRTTKNDSNLGYGLAFVNEVVA